MITMAYVCVGIKLIFSTSNQILAYHNDHSQQFPHTLKLQDSCSCLSCLSTVLFISQPPFPINLLIDMQPLIMFDFFLFLYAKYKNHYRDRGEKMRMQSLQSNHVETNALGQFRCLCSSTLVESSLYQLVFFFWMICIHRRALAQYRMWNECWNQCYSAIDIIIR